MKILNQKQIQQKIKRLAIEILEHNFEEPEIILAGINNNGMGFAKMLFKELKGLTKDTVSLTSIRLNPADPLSKDIIIEKPVEELEGKVVIIVDDVANTGRTIFYAFQPLMNIILKKLEVAVLVNRQHKSFPVKVDYMGISLATTARENIRVKILKVKEQAVFLD